MTSASITAISDARKWYSITTVRLWDQTMRSMTKTFITSLSVLSRIEVGRCVLSISVTRWSILKNGCSLTVCLRGSAKLIPLFNEQNNEDLLISVQTAGVYNGGKDKRGEKLAETEEDQLQARTDGSDAFDTLCIGCERFPQMTFDMFVTSSM